jgi:hypothetical protein
MTIFKLDYYVATIKRLEYTTNAKGNKKATYKETGTITKGYLSPA